MEETMKTIDQLRALLLASLLVCAALAACDTEDPSKAVVDNGYPASSGPVVYRAWWVATYFAAPVNGGATSTEQRSVPASDFAYAVLAPGWDPASGAAPSAFVFVKSKAALSVARGGTLHIVVDDQTFTGSCAANQPLTQDEADFITQRIFPGELGTMVYDAKTCAVSAAPSAASGATIDAGSDVD
jgi:hypothetical protein